MIIYAWESQFFPIIRVFYFYCPDIFSDAEYIMSDLSARRHMPLKLPVPSRPVERIVARIPVRNISPSPYQPRRIFSETALSDLAESIRQHGLLTPLLVRRISADQYELIAGERRLRALCLLGRTHAEAIVLSAYDQDCALLALVENLQREDLHYLDEAEAYRNILSGHGITQERLARSLSLSASALANRLRLLKLAPEVRDALRRSGLSERHARALLRIADRSLQLDLISECMSRHLSVKQLESRIDHLLRASEPPERPRVSPRLRDNRIVINAVLDTVRELNRIGVSADSRVEERADSIDVIVTIHTAAPSPGALPDVPAEVT